MQLTVEQDRFGFCLVSEVPATPEATEELSKRIGFIRETQCKYSCFPLPQCARWRDRLQTASFGNSPQIFRKGTRHIPRWHLVHTPIIPTLFVFAESGSAVTDVRDRRIHVDYNSSIFSPTPKVLAGPRCLSMASTLLRY